MQHTKKILIATIIILSSTSFAFASESDTQEELKLQIARLMEQIERLHLGQNNPAPASTIKPSLPTNRSTASTPSLSYTQKFSDSRLGILFSYNQPTKFTTKKVSKVNNKPVVARSFTKQNNEALFISLTDKEEAASLKLGLVILSMVNGVTNENGETVYISNRPVYIRGQLNSSVIDLEIKNRKNDSIGLFIWMQEVKNDSGTVVGSVNTTVGWGDSSRFTQSVTNTTYNGKSASQKAHFKTRLEAEVFMKEVMATMSIDSDTVSKLIE